MSNLYNKYLEMYRDDLDNNNDIITISGIEFLPSRVLQEMDPIAFKEGFYNWLDSIGLDSDSDKIRWNINL